MRGFAVMGIPLVVVMGVHMAALVMMSDMLSMVVLLCMVGMVALMVVGWTTEML